jgi:hypothetical protein
VCRTPKLAKRPGNAGLVIQRARQGQALLKQHGCSCIIALEVRDVSHATECVGDQPCVGQFLAHRQAFFITQALLVPLV